MRNLWWLIGQVRRFPMIDGRAIYPDIGLLLGTFLVADFVVIFFSRPTRRRFRPIWAIRIRLWIVGVPKYYIFEVVELSFAAILIVFDGTLPNPTILLEALPRRIKWFWHGLRCLHHLKLYGSSSIHIVNLLGRVLVRRRSWTRLKTGFLVYLGLPRIGHLLVSAERPTLILRLQNIILDPANRICLNTEGHVLRRIVLGRHLTWPLLVLLNLLRVFRLPERWSGLFLRLVPGFQTYLWARGLKKLSERFDVVVGGVQRSPPGISHRF